MDYKEEMEKLEIKYNNYDNFTIQDLTRYEKLLEWYENELNNNEIDQ